MNSNKKKELGQFFTKKNSWLTSSIKNFIKSNYSGVLLDPFAGKGDILLSVQKTLKIHDIVYGFDIDKNLNWKIHDSLVKIPKIKKSLIVTNPPYLSKNSCKRNKFNETYKKYFLKSKYEDLYMIALEKMIDSGSPGVAIIPETFINSSFPKEKINVIVIIEPNLFEDTEVPVCVVCFNGKNTDNVCKIYKNNAFIGIYSNLTKLIPEPKKILNTIKFNDKNGVLAIRGVDSTNPSKKICFCRVNELGYDINKIKNSSRSITIVSVNKSFTEQKVQKIIDKANKILNDYRAKTKDVLLSPFKGNNKNGERRRRLDYLTARKIISLSFELI